MTGALNPVHMDTYASCLCERGFRLHLSPSYYYMYYGNCVSYRCSLSCIQLWQRLTEEQIRCVFDDISKKSFVRSS